MSVRELLFTSVKQQSSAVGRYISIRVWHPFTSGIGQVRIGEVDSSSTYPLVTRIIPSAVTATPPSAGVITNLYDLNLSSIVYWTDQYGEQNPIVINITNPMGVEVKSVRIGISNDYRYGPKNIDIYTSNDQSNWVLLKSLRNVAWNEVGPFAYLNVQV